MQVLSDIHTNNTKTNLILSKDNIGGICLYGTSDMISGDSKGEDLTGEIVFINSFDENGEQVWYKIPTVNEMHIVPVEVVVDININIDTDGEKNPDFSV